MNSQGEVVSRIYSEPELELEIELIKNPDTGSLVEFEWRDIRGYEGTYQVSNYGHVRTFKILNNGILKNKLRKQITTEKGYKKVTLNLKGRGTNFRVHRLVAEAFIPNIDRKPCVNHKDFVRDFNFVLNLEWCSYSENNQYSIDNNDSLVGRTGESHYKTFLTEVQVKEICIMLDSKKYTQKEIASKFSTDYSVISRIHRGNTWNHLTRRKGTRGRYKTR